MLDSMTDKSVELAVRSQVAVADLVRRTRERLAAEHGQTAAEYIGIILVIVAVIAAISASGLGKTITGAINDAVEGVEKPEK
jgi:Flp pilus assembly pilin Flp